MTRRGLFHKIGYPGVAGRSDISDINTWILVAFGFGTMLVLGGVVTAMTLGSIVNLRESVIALTDAQQKRRDHIEALRTQIYISSILIRDYLLDRNSEAETRYADRIQENHAAALQQLDALGRLSSPTNNSTIKSFAAEIDAYWQSLEALVQDTTANRNLSPYEHLRTKIIPRRQAVIALAEELEDTAAAESRASRQAMAASIDAFQRYSTLLRAVTTVLAAVLALLITARVFRLERAARTEHARLERAEDEMRHLSQTVVTAQEQERRSLARELHDHVGQMVTSLRFGLLHLEHQCPAPSREFSETLGHCRLMLEQTIEAVRGIAMGLRPSMLDDLGLAAAIEWHCREFSKRFNIPVTVDVDPKLANWPEPQRTALYRVTQEALTNCARHAKAKSVRVDLVQTAEFVSLSITDDGVGIPQGQRPRGFGLLGIEERVREIGGRLNLRSPPTGGTILEVQLPLMGVLANAEDQRRRG